MDIFVIAAWAAIGSFIVALAGVILKVWRMRSVKKKRPRK